MKIEKIVGQRLQEGRAATGQTQAQLGAALAEYLGKPWSRQAWSAAEKGDRAFTAAELVACSLLLGCTVETLLDPPHGVETVELDDGQIDSRHLRSTVATNADLAELVDAVHDLRQHWPVVGRSVDKADQLLDRAVREVWRAARGRGIDVAQDELDERVSSKNARMAARKAEITGRNQAARQ